MSRGARRREGLRGPQNLSWFQVSARQTLLLLFECFVTWTMYPWVLKCLNLEAYCTDFFLLLFLFYALLLCLNGFHLQPQKAKIQTYIQSLSQTAKFLFNNLLEYLTNIKRFNYDIKIQIFSTPANAVSLTFCSHLSKYQLHVFIYRCTLSC